MPAEAANCVSHFSHRSQPFRACKRDLSMVQAEVRADQASRSSQNFGARLTMEVAIARKHQKDVDHSHDC